MLLSVDVETYDKNEEGVYIPTLNCQKFTLGAIRKESGQTEFFYNPEEMVKRLVEIIENEKKRGKRTFIYGHNLQYDFLAIFNKMLQKDVYIRFDNEKMIKYYSFYPFIAMYGKQNEDYRFDADAYFLDTMGYYRTSLAEMGKNLNLPKLEMPLEIRSPDDLKPYLERDVEITLESMLKIKKILKEFNFRPKKLLTAGNTSMTCFLTYCKKNHLSWVFSSAGRTYQGENMHLIRPAFRGGRIECFKTGIFENCVKLDVNSMYPYLMSKMDFPDLRTEKLFFKRDLEGIDINVLTDEIGVIKCCMKAPEKEELDYGYLPIRHKGMVYFPLGKELRGIWTILEIKEALKLGYKLVDYEWVVTYEKAHINPFSDYMNFLWEERQKREGYDKIVIKLLMNSLFGKWAQVRRDEILKLVDRKDLTEWEKVGFKFKEVSGDKYIISKLGDLKFPRYANPIISILITALGRDYLYKNMVKIPKEQMVYVSTDAIIYEEKDLNSLNDYGIRVGKGFGEFKIESKGECEILGENRYRFNDEISIGGIPKRDITLEVFKGSKKFTTNKIISIKEVMINRDLQSQIGKFTSEEVQLTDNFKGENMLPLVIDENGENESIWYQK